MLIKGLMVWLILQTLGIIDFFKPFLFGKKRDKTIKSCKCNRNQVYYLILIIDASVNSLAKDIISNRENQNWVLEKFNSHSRKPKIKINWTGKASKKIVFVNPILSNKDTNKNDWDIWCDVRKEGNNKNVDNVVTIPISKIKLRIL